MLTIIMEIPLAVGRATKYLQCRKIINMCHRKTRYTLINNGWYVCLFHIIRHKTGIQLFTRWHRIILLNYSYHIYHQGMNSKIISSKRATFSLAFDELAISFTSRLRCFHQQLILKGYCV